ncbi:hypothetical protein ACFQGT_12855 [Natrialbaceae archaeon GCM10025810]|uniref:HVO_0234 family beta-propeller protein n=1 Tax=Halovalidus salilacus TaxID=3075124 RepID=UPI0036156524
MLSIEEKRVYGEREGAIEVYVASSIGVVRVRVSGDAVGEFTLLERCDARDVAAVGDDVAAATDEDVLVLERTPGADAEGGDGDRADAEPAFEATGFGSAVAVGYYEADLVAAGEGGRVARRVDGTWETLEEALPAEVRAINGDLLATDGGVYRIHRGELDHAGLSDVRDVSVAGIPLAATGDGLYKLGNGWMKSLEGAFTAVAADPRTEAGRLARAHAIGRPPAGDGGPPTDDEAEDAVDSGGAKGDDLDGEVLYAYVDGSGGVGGADGSDDWVASPRSSDAAGGRIVDVGYGETAYAVTEDGTFLTERDAGRSEDDDVADPDANRWRPHTLGVRGVSGLAVSLPDPDSIGG